MTDSSQNLFDRRSFMKIAGLTGGGVLIGFNFFTACKSQIKVPVDLSKLDFNDFNAYIRIADNGAVTLFSTNPEIGQGVKTAMPMIIAEELDVAWENVYVQQAPLDIKNYKNQEAGGSDSIKSSWDALRQVGASARQMLVNAAALKWQIDASECTTSEGIITNSTGAQLTYGDVVKEAATLEIPKDIKLKSPGDFKIIGKEIRNVDNHKIITGKPLYGLDYKKEGMLIANVLRPPAFGQKLASFNDSDTRVIPGVVDVIQFGDKIAVLAKNTWTAMKGKKALKAVWKDDGNLESDEDHNKILLGLLDGDDFKSARSDGNVQSAFDEADQIVERTYEGPFLPHNCMEPMNFFAHVTKDKIHLVGPVQMPKRSAKSAAEKIGRSLDNVQLEMTRIGGGFGRRLEGDYVMEAVEISHAAKKPIKVVFSREDDMMSGYYKPKVKYRIKASIKNGEISGYHIKEASVNKNIWNSIASSFPAGAIDNYKYDFSRYNSNITSGFWRAPMTNFIAFAEQSFFDELAALMNIDAVQLRLNLIQKAKQKRDKIEYSPERLEGVINLVAEKSAWGKKKHNTYQGFAVFYSHESYVAEVAEVAIENGNPVVKKIFCAVDCGIVVNMLGARTQVEGAILDGLGHAMYGELTFKDGLPSSNNFDSYRLIRIGETPEIETYFVKNNIAPTGLGEPALPPAGPAVANAIKAATGQRLYKQPFINQIQETELAS